MELIKNIEKETVFNLAAAVPAEAGKVNSLTLSQMPGAPHAVRGVTAFKMLLVVILPA